MARRWANVNLVAPTREGWAYLALLGGVLFGAANTGNNLVYFVLSVLLAGLVVANVLAEWNLRALTVARRLPAELRDGLPAGGHFVLHNPRGRGAAWLVEVDDAEAGAHAVVEHCAPGASVEVPAAFLLAGRGLRPLRSVRLSSRFPFGLVRRWRDLDLPAEVLVFPRGAGRAAPYAARGEGDDATDRGRASEAGEFAGLRPYRPGDPLRRVHWPSSARSASPLVVVRVAEGGEQVTLELDPTLTGEAREEAIRRLAGRAETHLAQGDAVGLLADEVALPARSGVAWRRRLLTALALLEAR